MSTYNPYSYDYYGYDPTVGNNADRLNRLNAAEGNSLAQPMAQTAGGKLIGSLAQPFQTAQQSFQGGPQFKFDDSHFSGPVNDKGLRPLNDAGKAYVGQTAAQWKAPDNSSLISHSLANAAQIGASAPQMQGQMPIQKGLIGRAFDNYVGDVLNNKKNSILGNNSTVAGQQPPPVYNPNYNYFNQGY